VAASRGFRSGEAPWNRQITPETDLVRAVAEAKGAGATFLKLYAALDSVMVTRAIVEAHRQGLRVMAHATTFPGKPSDLVAAGVNILTHAAYLVWEGSPRSTEFPKRARGDFGAVAPDGPVMDGLLRAMHDRDVALNPTLWIFASGPGRDSLAGTRTPWMNRVTQRAQQLGVTIVAGTDAFVDAERDPLPLLHRELEALVAAGLTPMEALVAATRGAAHAIGVGDLRGTLRAGTLADIVLLAADPSADIRGTRQIRYVVKDGRIVFTATSPRPAR
jgi:imidazolonepropionase-like amidohydrolase